MKLKSLIPLNVLKEADEEGAEATGTDDAGAGGNPFAGAGGEGGGGGETSGAEGDDASAADDTKKGPEIKPIEVNFEPSVVRKYNKSSFQGSKGVVTAITKQGLTVQVPNGPEIFVSFKDIK